MHFNRILKRSSKHKRMVAEVLERGCMHAVNFCALNTLIKKYWRKNIRRFLKLSMHVAIGFMLSYSNTLLFYAHTQMYMHEPSFERVRERVSIMQNTIFFLCNIAKTWLTLLTISWNNFTTTQLLHDKLAK